MKIKLLIIGFLILIQKSFCQDPESILSTAPGFWQTTGNPSFGLHGVTPLKNYLGSETMNDVEIRLGTNGTTRFFIQNSLGNTGGFLGAGNNFLNPQSNIHIHEFSGFEGQNEYLQFTNDATTVTPTRGFKVGITMQEINLGATNPIVPLAQIIQQEEAPLRFYSRSGTDISGRMTISSGTGYNNSTNQTRIGINSNGNGPIDKPVALLHLGLPLPSGGAGFRSWMDLGTFIYGGTDNVYLGLKPEGTLLSGENTSDRMDAVLNWGDNVTNSGDLFPNGPDNLRFIFTSPIAGTLNDPYNSGGTNGLEVARMTPQGHMGIGAVFTNLVMPKRRMDIHHDGSGAQGGVPQLRLTNTLNRDITLGAFTDFQATANGDLLIMPMRMADHRFVGIGINGTATPPQNTLEISSSAASPTPSGLRFRNLTSSSGFINNNPTNTVLSVNANGDVILVRDQVGTGGGNATAENGLVDFNNSPSGKIELGGTLKHNTTVSTAGYSLEFNHSSSGNISIGNNAALNPAPAGVAANIALGTGNTFLSQNCIGIGKNNTLKVFDFAIGENNNLQYSSGSLALGYSNIIGSNNDQISAAQTLGEFVHSYGSHSTAIGQQVVLPRDNVGVSIGSHWNTEARTKAEEYFVSNPTATTANLQSYLLASGYASYIPAINVTKNNSVGIGYYVPTQGAKLDVNGSIYMSGQALNGSDSTLKMNILNLTDSSLSLIRKITPRSYEWINKYDTLMYGPQYGVIAQQVERVIPSLVRTDLDGKKMVSYDGLFTFLLKAFQEQADSVDQMKSVLTRQDSINNALQSQLSHLEQLITQCCSNSGAGTKTVSDQGKISSIDVELTAANVVVLEQNSPNPFAEHTLIKYSIPEDVGFAQMLFFDKVGRIIKTVDIKERGAGVVNVYAETLSAGTYSYSLIVDGKVFETKQMIKTK